MTCCQIAERPYPTGTNGSAAIAGSTLHRVGAEIDAHYWPMLLTPSPSSDQDKIGPFLHQSVKDYIASHSSVGYGYVLGGLAAIGRRAHSQLEAIL